MVCITDNDRRRSGLFNAQVVIDYSNNSKQRNIPLNIQHNSYIFSYFSITICPSTSSRNARACNLVSSKCASTARCSAGRSTLAAAAVCRDTTGTSPRGHSFSDCACVSSSAVMCGNLYIVLGLSLSMSRGMR